LFWWVFGGAFAVVLAAAVDSSYLDHKIFDERGPTIFVWRN